MSEPIFPADWWRLSSEEYKDAKGRRLIFVLERS